MIVHETQIQRDFACLSALRYSIDRGGEQVEHGTSNAFSSQALPSKNLGCNGASRHIGELVQGRPGTQTLHAGTDHVPLRAQTHGQQWQARDHGLNCQPMGWSSVFGTSGQAALPA